MSGGGRRAERSSRLRRVRKAAISAVAAGLVLAAGTLPAAGRPAGPPGPPRAPIDDADVKPLDTEGIDPVLDGIDVEPTDDIDKSDERFEEAAQAEGQQVLRWLAADRVRLGLIARSADANLNVQRAQQEVDRAAAAVAAEQTVLERLQGVEDLRRAALAVQQRELRRLAAAIVASSPVDQYAFLGNFDDFTRADRRQAVRERSIDQQGRRVEVKRRPWAAARKARRAQDRKVAAAVSARRRAETALRQAVTERDNFGVLLAQATTKTNEQIVQLERAKAHTHETVVLRRAARMTSYVKDQDLPLAALDAYWRASGRAPCFVPWWILAGVGRVETRHGTAQGSKVQPDGTTTKHILGPVLNGGGGTAAVHDTDGGLLDDDPVWDRAVGPMQFIPGTWVRWSIDDNGDTKVDPHNLYDAAGAAANYLCFRYGDLTDDASIRLALLTYNRSEFYVSEVRRFADGYRDALGLPDARGILPDDAVDPSATTGGATTTTTGG